MLTFLKGPFAAGPWDVFRNITGTTLPAICYGVASKGLKRRLKRKCMTVEKRDKGKFQPKKYQHKKSAKKNGKVVQVDST